MMTLTLEAELEADNFLRLNHQGEVAEAEAEEAMAKNLETSAGETMVRVIQAWKHMNLLLMK